MVLARPRPSVLPVVLAALALACGSGTGSSGSSGGSGSGTGGSGGGGSGGGGSGESCLGSTLLSSLGKSRVLVGFSGTDTARDAAPYDLRYQYIAGNLPDGAGPCTSCASGCTAGGASCDNAHGCNWWGCWQYDQDPPGSYAGTFIAGAKAAAKGAQIPMLTYYVILPASGVSEGSAEVTQAANDPAFMARYLADWRFLLQKIGSEVVVLHVEPDFWGYAQQVASAAGVDATGVPAKVKSANPTDCAGQPDTLAGLGRCMIAMVRKYAPNAKVGLHASMWGSGWGVASSYFDPATEAGKTAAFMKSAGVGDGDFVVSDLSDRDAQYYQLVRGNPDTWYDTNNVKLPNFHEAFTWAKALAEGVGVPLVWWQIPVGNASGNGTTNHYQDNRVDYLLGHVDEVAASHGVALAFGAGEDEQTNPDTDGGNLAAKTTAYVGSGGAALCR